MTYVLDMHALVFVWFLEGSLRLSLAARNAHSDIAAPVLVPTIALAEITFP
jgi:PIN domain nuclease of toxin-antitoxin system